MQCWVCKRQARGYGHSDGRFKPGDPRHYVLDWVFCSRRCQNAFHLMYGNWARVQRGYLDKTEVTMIDPSDVEQAAMHKCLKAFGEAAGEIGFDKPLGSYSEAQALCVIDAIVTCYTQAMVEHHEATKYPPVKGLKPISDPLVADPLVTDPSNPFADLEDDLPWEEPKGARS